MTAITDEFMREMSSKTKPYCIVILKAGPNKQELGSDRGRAGAGGIGTVVAKQEQAQITLADKTTLQHAVGRSYCTY